MRRETVKQTRISSQIHVQHPESLSKHSDADDVNTPPDACRALTYTCAIELDVFEDFLPDAGVHWHDAGSDSDVRTAVEQALGRALNTCRGRGRVKHTTQTLHASGYTAYRQLGKNTSFVCFMKIRRHTI